MPETRVERLYIWNKKLKYQIWNHLPNLNLPNLKIKYFFFKSKVYNKSNILFKNIF